MPRVSINARINAEIKELENHLLGLRTGQLRSLATASGVSLATLFRVRQGRTTPEPATIDAIWAGLDRLDEADREAP